jgi:hypothetical protein
MFLHLRTTVLLEHVFGQFCLLLKFRYLYSIFLFLTVSFKNVLRSNLVLPDGLHANEAANNRLPEAIIVQLGQVAQHHRVQRNLGQVLAPYAHFRWHRLSSSLIGGRLLFGIQCFEFSV